MDQQLVPGRELDALVAEKVFGAEVSFLNQRRGWRIDYRANKDECNDPIWTDYGVDGCRLKKYSTDISAAWEVLKHFKEKYGENTIVQINADCDCGWRAELGEARYPEPSRTGIAFSESLPGAICLAALKAAKRASE